MFEFNILWSKSIFTLYFSEKSHNLSATILYQIIKIFELFIIFIL